MTKLQKKGMDGYPKNKQQKNKKCFLLTDSENENKNSDDERVTQSDGKGENLQSESSKEPNN